MAQIKDLIVNGASRFLGDIYGTLKGNADTATKLTTARTIQTNLGSTSSASFNGTVNITPGVTGTLAIANGGTGATSASGARTNLEVPSNTGSGASGTWGISISGNAATSTLASYALKMQTYKQGSTTETYGTSYPLYAQWENGNGLRLKCDNYTVKTDAANKLATARTLTIGNTGKTFDGSGDVSWSLSEIGAAATSHGTHVPSVCTAITDWNSATSNGWYMGNNISNQPVANGGWFYGFTIVHNSNYLRQIAWHFSSDNSVAGTNNDRFERVKYNGTWGSWVNTSVRVAVPSDAKFTDTNTTYSAGTGLSLSGTTFSVSYGTSASALGTSSAGSASTVSRSDHVHELPALTSCTGTLTVAKGGTGATSASDARTNLEVPSKTGDGASGTWGISISGNAATSTLASYALKMQTYKIGSTTETYGTSYPLYAQWESSNGLRLKCDNYTVKTDAANKLATARTIQTNLGSTSSVSFDGSADITPGVTGVLAVGNGGTGATTATGARAILGAYPQADMVFTTDGSEQTTNIKYNDKTVYRRIYSFGSINASNELRIETGLGNTLDMVFTLRGIARLQDPNYIVSLPYSEPRTNFLYSIQIIYADSEPKILIGCPSGAGISSGFAILEYTKK